MAIVDVVKCTMDSRTLVAKFPSNDLRIGTQLVVYPGQTAFFVKGGRIYDEFTSGTYTLTTNNIPLLNKLLNLPFGGGSPFQAEVWFVNQVAVLDSKWGTAPPLQIEDPKYGVIVPVRAFGQYGFSVGEPRTFIEQIVGNVSLFTADRLNVYFRGKILSKLTNLLSDKLTKDGISVLNINSYLSEISEACSEGISEFFKKYGIDVQTFDIISISVKEDDPSYLKLKNAKDLAARLKITGRDVYQMDRSFNVLDRAAANEGASATMMNAGMGLGMGAGIGVGLGQQAGAVASVMNTNPATPPPLSTVQQAFYYLAINNQQQGPFAFQDVVNAVQSGQIDSETLVWKQGMAAWAKLSTLPEIQPYLSCPPPLPNA